MKTNDEIKRDLIHHWEQANPAEIREPNWVRDEGVPVPCDVGQVMCDKGLNPEDAIDWLTDLFIDEFASGLCEADADYENVEAYIGLMKGDFRKYAVYAALKWWTLQIVGDDIEQAHS